MKVYPDNADLVLQNRQKFFATLGLDASNMVLAGLVHGDNIVVVGKENIGQKIENTDGLITKEPGVILTITVADCLPVYFFDKSKKVTGLAHAGWRGVKQNIVSLMLSKIQSEFASDPADVEVNIGPHIRNCHFEIKDDVAEQFANYSESIIKEGNSIKLDLSAIVKKQLENAGVRPDNVTISDECTYCLNQKYYSFRRDRPERVEAMVAYAVMGDFLSWPC